MGDWPVLIPSDDNTAGSIRVDLGIDVGSLQKRLGKHSETTLLYAYKQTETNVS